MSSLLEAVCKFTFSREIFEMIFSTERKDALLSSAICIIGDSASNVEVPKASGNHVGLVTLNRSLANKSHNQETESELFLVDHYQKLTFRTVDFRLAPFTEASCSKSFFILEFIFVGVLT